MTAIYKTKDLRSSLVENSALTPDGWVPARPYSQYRLFQRIKAAFGVLFGNYDAIDWEQD